MIKQNEIREIVAIMRERGIIEIEFFEDGNLSKIVVSPRRVIR